MRKASDIILAMIVRDYITSAAEWKRAEDIPNSMYPSRKIICKKVDGAAVTIEGYGKADATLKKDAGFKDGSRKRNLAVWTLSGEGASTTTPEAVRPVAAKKPGAKTGKYQPAHEEASRLRFQIAVIAENEHAIASLAGHKHVLSHYAMGLVCHIRDQHSELYFKRVLPILDKAESDFYILIDPHTKLGVAPVIDDDIIAMWWGNPAGRKASMCYADYCTMICGDIAKGNGDAFYNQAHRAVLHDAVDALRSQGAVGGNTGGLISEYNSIAANNRLNGKEFLPSGPGSIAEYYANNPEMKLIHDELRFCLCNQMGAISELSGDEYLAAFKEIIQWVGEFLHNARSVILGGSNIETIRLFVGSSCYMYFACTEAEVRGRRKTTTDPEIAKSKRYLFDMDLAKIDMHKRLFEPVSVDIIKTLASTPLTDEQRAKILALVGSN
jgi:hypothetical protein